MKKFGTPTGAGPGSAKLKVGFVAAGAPEAERSGLGFVVVEVVVVFGFPCGLEFDLTLGLAEWDCGWLVELGELGLPAVVEVELERECELDDDEEEEDEEDLEEDELELLLEEPEGDDVVVVAVPVGVVQDWVTPTTGRLVSVCGSTVAPAGSATLNTSWRPPATVTVTVQGSAIALAGMATRPATIAQHVAKATLSFMRMVTG